MGEKGETLSLIPDEFDEMETVTITRRISRDEATVALEQTLIGSSGRNTECLSEVKAMPNRALYNSITSDPNFTISRHLTTFPLLYRSRCIPLC